MSLRVEIDSRSGFCGGVIRAIEKAESYLGSHQRLFSLGSIVHNEAEENRLRSKGLETVTIDTLPEEGTVLIRAHGEPPSTYTKLESCNLEIIDCTCPVVLKLQQRIKSAYEKLGPGRIVIFGKVGHAEVLGLVGQTGGNAVVVENMQMLQEAIAAGRIPSEGPLELFSQTTKSPEGYKDIGQRLSQFNPSLVVHDTICRQVASRHEQLEEFASSHDVIVFVAGRESSNGKVLFDLCKKVNQESYHIVSPEEIDFSWFEGKESVGVCGATSTPKWLLEEVASEISQAD